MNALELADWIENGAPFGKYETAKQAVTMLRQQQAEIEASFNRGYKEGARDYANKTHPAELTDDYVFICKRCGDEIGIEYKPSELTDEEIEIECRKAWGLHDKDQLNLEEVLKFAKAILRKAQEK